MTQAQLLAIDTILPTILGISGIVFLAFVLIPGVRSSEGKKRDVLSTLALFIVGLAFVAVSVILWRENLAAAGQAASPAPSSSSPAVATPSATVRPTPESASAAPASIGATPAVSPTTAITVSAASPAATPAPVPPVSFQPDNGAAHDITIAVEPFEHGLMLYRSDTKQIYVMDSAKNFTVYPDTWMETDPPQPALTPPSGDLQPRRGFGKLWLANPEVRQTLGWAKAPETGMGAQASGDGAATTIKGSVTYLFNKDGSYTTK